MKIVKGLGYERCLINANVWGGTTIAGVKENLDEKGQLRKRDAYSV